MLLLNIIIKFNQIVYMLDCKTRMDKYRGNSIQHVLTFTNKAFKAPGWTSCQY